MLVLYFVFSFYDLFYSGCLFGFVYCGDFRCYVMRIVCLAVRYCFGLIMYLCLGIWLWFGVLCLVLLLFYCLFRLADLGLFM